jgi:hypothetical protein
MYKIKRKASHNNEWDEKRKNNKGIVERKEIYWKLMCFSYCNHDSQVESHFINKIYILLLVFDFMTFIKKFNYVYEK